MLADRVEQDVAAVIAAMHKAGSERGFVLAVAILLTSDEPATAIGEQDEADDDMR